MEQSDSSDWMGDRARRAERRIEVPILVASAATLPALALQYSDNDLWRAAGYVSSALIWCAFLFEVVVMLRLVNDRRRWVREHPLEIVIVVLTAPFITGALQALRFVRLARLLRLVRLLPFLRAVFGVRGLQWVLAFTAFFTAAAAAAYQQFEGGTYGDAVYWVITTMTTVGYGDLSPGSTDGKVLAVLVMVVGVAFAATVTGALADRFIQARRDEEFTDPGDTGLLDRVDALARQVDELREAVRAQVR